MYFWVATCNRLEFFSPFNSPYTVNEMIDCPSISKWGNQRSESLNNLLKITQLVSTAVRVSFITPPVFWDRTFFLFQTQLHGGKTDMHIYLVICSINIYSLSKLVSHSSGSFEETEMNKTQSLCIWSQSPPSPVNSWLSFLAIGLRIIKNTGKLMLYKWILKKSMKFWFASVSS